VKRAEVGFQLGDKYYYYYYYYTKSVIAMHQYALHYTLEKGGGSALFTMMKVLLQTRLVSLQPHVANHINEKCGDGQHISLFELEVCDYFLLSWPLLL